MASLIVCDVVRKCSWLIAAKRSNSSGETRVDTQIEGVGFLIETSLVVMGALFYHNVRGAFIDCRRSSGDVAYLYSFLTSAKPSVHVECVNIQAREKS